MWTKVQWIQSIVFQNENVLYFQKLNYKTNHHHTSKVSFPSKIKNKAMRNVLEKDTSKQRWRANSIVWRDHYFTPGFRDNLRDGVTSRNLFQNYISDQSISSPRSLRSLGSYLAIARDCHGRCKGYRLGGQSINLSFTKHSKLILSSTIMLHG